MRIESGRLGGISLDSARIPSRSDEKFSYEHVRASGPVRQGRNIVFFNQFCFCFAFVLFVVVVFRCL